MSEPTRRLATPPEGKFPEKFDTGSICFWKDHRGVWMLYLPGAGLGDLSNHDVTEHEDGSITVAPSVLVTSGRGTRHGFIRRGRWEPCADDQAPNDAP